MSDQGPTFLSSFWHELFKLQVFVVHYSTAYYPQSNGQSEVVSNCLESYLWWMANKLSHTWLTWFPLAKYWYKTNYHSSIKMTSFEALYGYVVPIHIPYFPHDSISTKVDTMF